MKTSNQDIIGYILSSAGKMPLLTQEEELVLGRQVQKMVKVDKTKEEMTHILGYTPSDKQLSEELDISESELRGIYTIGIRAQRRFVECNMRLAINIAKKYSNRGLPLEDLIQEGGSGIARAALKFDPERGYKFSTYATWWIRQSITRAISDKSRSIRLPIHIVESMNKIKKVWRLLSQEYGKAPTFDQIDQHLEWKPGETRRICELHNKANKVDSINRKVGDDDPTEIGNFIGTDEDADPINQAAITSLGEEIDTLLECLNPNEKYVIKARYGFDGGQMTLSHIGTILNVSRERVRQIERKALQKLKNKTRLSQLKELIL